MVVHWGYLKAERIILFLIVSKIIQTGGNIYTTCDLIQVFLWDFLQFLLLVVNICHNC